MSTTFTYDLATEIGQVRLLIFDNDIVPESDAVFCDEEIQVFLNLESNVRTAAAAALETMAADAARTAKSLKTMTWAEDTRNVPQAILATAKRYRDEDASAPAAGFAQNAWGADTAFGILDKDVAENTP